MASAWSPEQVLRLAPDAGSAKSGKDLATPRKWVSLGCNDDVLWGECQGSGASPYQTKIELTEPAFHCSCPSRKFPCKHALGLFLLWAGQPQSLAQGAPPAWVTSWLEARSQRAEKKAAKEQEKQEKIERGEAVGDESARAKRQAARMQKLAAGLDELALWLSDLVRHGLASVQNQPPSFWEERARRLIDAQAPGAARRLLRVAALPMVGDGWQAGLLEHLARLHLLIEGFRHVDTLAPGLQADLRTALGVTADLDEVRAGPGVRDVWLVVGHRVVSDTLDARLNIHRTWLIGRDSKRPALLLDFIHQSQAAAGLENALPPGTSLDAELAFFPGTVPLRAVIKQRHATPEPLDSLPGQTTIAASYGSFVDALARTRGWIAGR